MTVDVELAQRFDLIAEKFQPERQWRVPRIDIDNAATHGELSPSGYLGDALITTAHQLFNKLFHLCCCAACELDNSRLQRAALWRTLIEAGARRDDNAGPAVTLDFCEQRQSFRCDFRIRQNVFDRRKLGLWKEKRIWLPVKQTFVK